MLFAVLPPTVSYFHSPFIKEPRDVCSHSYIQKVEVSAVEWFAQDGEEAQGDPTCAGPQVQAQHCALRMTSKDPSEHLCDHAYAFGLWTFQFEIIFTFFFR